MEISYRREIKHNYLVIIPEPVWDCGYEARMLAGNEVQGLLHMSIRYQNGIPVYYYDITSRQPLGRLLETRFITRDEICQLLIQIHVALMRMEEYLLSDSGILLKPEFIYMEPELFQIGLCLVPGKKGDFAEELSSFLQYILKCVNHKDRECVVLAYGVYHESLKDNYGMDDILKFITPESEKKGRFGDRLHGDTEEGRNIYGAEEKRLDVETERRVMEAERHVPEMKRHGPEMKRHGPETDRLVSEAERPVSEMAGREDIAAGEIKKVRLPVGTQVMMWIAAVVLLPGALWLFKGWQSVLELRRLLLLMDVGLLLIIIVADGLYLWLKRTGRAGQHKVSQVTEHGFTVEPEDSSWRILYEEEDDEVAEQKYEDIGAQVLGKETAAGTEEIYQTTLLSDRLTDDSVHRLTPLNTGGEEILIPYYPFVIGKHKELADYALIKDTVSRFHLRIDNGVEGFTVTDLNSTNGTRVKGHMLDANETVPIEIGDEIYIADAGYIFS